MRIERLNIAVLPRTARLNKQRFNLHRFQPFLYFLGRKFQAIVAADNAKVTTTKEQTVEANSNRTKKTDINIFKTYEEQNKTIIVDNTRSKQSPSARRPKSGLIALKRQKVEQKVSTQKSEEQAKRFVANDPNQASPAQGKESRTRCKNSFGD
jgi:hypothetical protein